MKYRCIIIDDNIIECDSLALKLKQIACLEIYATLSSGLEAVNILRDNKIDIVFSDIDMPGLSGIELLKSTKNHPVFIFIS
ncbi:response regulator, partial [Xanthomonas citri pv. citri]|nr:response regulator [Xanthomonas citri pv. citri]